MVCIGCSQRADLWCTLQHVKVFCDRLQAFLSPLSGKVGVVTDMNPVPLAWVWLGLWLLLWPPASFEKCIFDDVQSLDVIVSTFTLTILCNTSHCLLYAGGAVSH